MDSLAAGVVQARETALTIGEIRASIDSLNESVAHIDELRDETAYMWMHIDQVVDDVEELGHGLARVPLALEAVAPDGVDMPETHKPSVTFAHLDAEDLVQARQASRLAGQALLRAFEPAPSIDVQPHAEHGSADASGASGASGSDQQGAHVSSKRVRPRYGAIGYGSGMYPAQLAELRPAEPGS